MLRRDDERYELHIDVGMKQNNEETLGLIWRTEVKPARKEKDKIVIARHLKARVSAS